LTAVIYRGSVKDVYQVKSGVVFSYSDRYSIFDWGEMPDLIENKGLNLAKMHVWSYRLFENHQVLTHLKGFYEGKVSEKVEVKEFSKFSARFDSRVNQFIYQTPFISSQHWALPVEVVFRFVVYRTSAFFDRIDDCVYLRRLGLSDNLILKIQEKKRTLHSNEDSFQLPVPVVEYFTKLEPVDRVLSREEVLLVSGLTEEQLKSISFLTLKVAIILKEYLSKSLIELNDGKLEWGLDRDQGQFVLIDAIGPDELRMTYKGVQLSKELLRHYYRHTDWYSQIQTAKSRAAQSGNPNWKELLPEACMPPPLPKKWRDIISKLYSYFGTLGESSHRPLDPDLYQAIQGLK